MPLLTAQNRDVIGLTILLAVTVLANVLVHWLAICPRLYRHGAKFPTGLVFWRVLRELREYKDLTVARGRALTFYYLDFILSWFSLFLAFALVLRILWVQTHPGDFLGPRPPGNHGTNFFGREQPLASTLWNLLRCDPQ